MEYPLVDTGDKESGRASATFSDVSSASDATLSEWPFASSFEAKSRGSNDGSDGDDDEDVDALDEEERIALTASDARSRSHGARFGTRTQRVSASVRAATPFGLAVVVILLLVPALHWLSSASTAPTQPDADTTSRWKPVNALLPHQPPLDQADVDTVTLPFYSNPHNGPLGTSEAVQPNFAPSSIDAKGNWGLGGASPFGQVGPVYPGWSTPAEAKEVNARSSIQGSTRLKQITMDEIYNGTFTPKSAEINWNKEDPKDGVFTFVDPNTGDIVTQSVTDAKSEQHGRAKRAKKVVVRKSEIKDANGQQIDFDSYRFSPDMRYALLTTEREKNWRHSTFFKAYMYDRKTKQLRQIIANNDKKLSLARIVPSPQGTIGVIFVSERDVYFLPAPDADVVRITSNGAGSQTIFNGSPDWVYEEEILAGDSAIWVSPDGANAVFLRLDETAVPIYSFPLYNANKSSAGGTPPYPGSVEMKYPKPGYANPTVTTFSIDLNRVRDLSQAGRAHAAEVEACKTRLDAPGGMDRVDQALAGSDAARANRLVTEVVWLGPRDVLVRETDRTSQHGRLLHFDLSTSHTGSHTEGTAVRRLTSGSNGWLEIGQTIVSASNTSSAYVEVAPDANGFRHVAFYPSASASSPIWLTTGEWEIDGGITHIDLKRERVYITAAYPVPSTRQVCFVPLPRGDHRSPQWSATSTPTIVTDASKGGWNSATFDPKGAYYLLAYDSPLIPPTYTILGIDDPHFALVLEDNADLSQRVTEYTMPSTIFYNVTLPSGEISTVKELRPHDFEQGVRKGSKYPVLINVYGGPDSQLVQQRWARAHLHHYLTSALGYIVATIDGTGTGFRGTAYRAPVSRNLGVHETNDTIAAAALLGRLPYTDASRLGVWGWSYGGYLTSKVIEADVDHVLSLGMAVAPVTKWAYYDSVYTERYQGLPSPEDNAKGYAASDVQVTPAFHSHAFALAHGSGDDNVHYENSAHLLDLLTTNKVRDVAFRMFTDSDHGINTRGAFAEVHNFLLRFLVEHWGPGGRRRLALLPSP